MAEKSPYNADGTIRNRPPAPKPKLPQPYGASGSPREETGQRHRFEQLQARVESLRAEGKTGLAEQVQMNIEQQFPDMDAQPAPESAGNESMVSAPESEHHRRLEELQKRARELRDEGETGRADQAEANIEEQFPEQDAQATSEPGGDSGDAARADSEPEATRRLRGLMADLPDESEGRDLRSLQPSDRGPDGERGESASLLADLQQRLDRIEKLQRKLIQMQPSTSKDVDRPVFS